MWLYSALANPRLARARRTKAIAHLGFASMGEVGLLAVVLRYSRALWAQWVELDASSAAFSSALIHAARHFGGSPRLWVFEDPDCRVLQWDGHREYFADELEVSARHLRSRLGVWHGRYRGPADKMLLYLYGAARCPRRDGLLQGNASLRVVLEATMRLPHPRLPGRSIGDALREERSYLSPLPRWLV